MDASNEITGDNNGEPQSGGLIGIGVILIGLCISLLCLYILFNGISALSCLASEGNITWNKVVIACHFEDSPMITQQIIQTSVSSDCYLNGERINCSADIMKHLEVNGHYKGYAMYNNSERQ